MNWEKAGDALIWNDDCFRAMRSMKDKSTDVVITDPPFGEITHAGARTRNGMCYDGNKATKNVVFDCLPPWRFITFAAECVRVARRWVVMTCDWRHAALAEDVGLPVVRCGVWVKPDGSPQFTGDRPATGWEAALILHRPGKKRWNGGGKRAVWECPTERGSHPTQKPVALLRNWVRLFSDPGETILDPMMGSGSTLIAAILEGRKAFGIEKDEVHYRTAAARLLNPRAKTHGNGRSGKLFERECEK